MTEYFGEYTVTSYSGNIFGGGTYTAAATHGCFFLITEQPVDKAAQPNVRRFAAPAAAASPNAFGDGEPNEPGTEAETFLDEGAIASLTINNLTSTSGSGTFSFTNSAAATATGTITITGSRTVGPAETRHRLDVMRAMRMRPRTH